MTRFAPLALFLAVPALAAPLPDAERDRLAVARVYGAWTDPLGGCSFRAAGPRLHVRLPEYPRGIVEYMPGPIDAPRFVRRMAGDFTASVRAEVPRQPDERLGSANGQSRFVAAGLTAEDGRGSRAGIRKFEKMDGGHRTAYGSAFRMANGGGGGSGTGAGKDSDTRLFLRLARKGTQVQFATSTDGKAWREYGKQEVGWAGEVALGVIAENTTGVAVEVTFDHFAVTEAKE
ncbi:MAG: hypothetical protein U0804_05920 [Gemmataceae bacterium]